MIFEIGDIVICTGFDHLSKGYDGQNLLEMCGFDRNHKFEIIEIFIDSLLFDNPSQFLSTSSKILDLTNTSTFTIEAWVYPTSSFSKENRFIISDVVNNSNTSYWAFIFNINGGLSWN